MEQVFSSEGAAPGRTFDRDLPAAPGSFGRVAEALGKDLYLVDLEGGGRVRAESTAAMRIGDVVRISPPRSARVAREGQVADFRTGGAGGRWSALIPLAFGGKGSTAGLEIVVERRQKGTKDKREPAVYFVFTVRTGAQGEVQWSVHLNGRQLALQVYAAHSGGNLEPLKVLVRTVEKNLARSGFQLAGPTAFLGRPFKLPGGHRLNVRG